MGQIVPHDSKDSYLSLRDFDITSFLPSCFSEIPIKIVRCLDLQPIIFKSVARLPRIWTSSTYSLDKEVFTGLAVEASM